MEQMDVVLERGASGETAVARVRGPLTLSTLHLLEDAMKRVTDADAVIDVTDVPYIDSAGLGTILAFWQHNMKMKRRFALTGVNKRVAMLLDLTKVDTILPLCKTAEDADLAFARSRAERRSAVKQLL